MNKFKVTDFEGIFLTKPDIKVEGDLVVGTRDNIDFYRKKIQQETSEALKNGTSPLNTTEKVYTNKYQYKPNA